MISLREIKTATWVAFTATALLFTSCSKSNCCKVVKMDVDLDVRNELNQSVFDKALPNYLTQDSIEIFYLKNGKYELVKNTGYDAANGFLFFSTNSQPAEYTLRVMVSSFTDGKSESFTLVKYGSIKTDTIKTKITNAVIQKIWLNETEISLSGKPYLRVIN